MRFIVTVLILIVLFFLMKKRKGITNTIQNKMYSEQLSKNFTLAELLVTNTGLPNIPDEQEKNNLKKLTVNVLQPVRDLLDVPVVVNSAFRSEPVNLAVGGVSNSQHRLGFAADIVPQGIDLYSAFVRIGKSGIPYDQLIIEKNQRGNSWIHISYNPSGGRRQTLQANFDPASGKMIYNPILLA